VRNVSYAFTAIAWPGEPVPQASPPGQQPRHAGASKRDDEWANPLLP
jgi:hypothetical protein